MNQCRAAVGLVVITVSVTALALGDVEGVAGASAQSPPAAAGPTFNAQIAPILNANCVTCHRPDGIAPFSLLTYQDAQPRAAAIKAATAAHVMPPWYADPQYGQFKNARGLTQAQIDMLAAWADGGAPQGTGAPPAPPKVEAQGWALDRPPDQIIELPFGEFDLPAQGEVPAFTVWLKPFRDERMVQAIQIRPSVHGAVHHSSLSLGQLPRDTRIARAQVFEGGPVLDGAAVFGDGRPYWPPGGEHIERPIMFYVPGGGLLRFDDGLAKRFRRDDYMAWGLHLVSRGRSEKLRVQIGVWFARRYPRREVRLMTLTETLTANGQPLPQSASGETQFPIIPPGAADFAMTGSRRFPRDVTIYALWPHMHYRGKDMRFVLTEPNGKETTLLNVPAYNPHWQLTYELAKPLKVKRGSVITAYGHFDNSAANHHNPDPTAAVKFGQQGTDEMYLPFLEASVDDEDLRLEQFNIGQ
jgi:hypothetical protein